MTERKREYIDLWFKLDEKIFAIELKYKTRKRSISVGAENFELRNQAAHDIGRYDFIKDIGRLERFTAATPNSIGYAILLTNDSSYWTETKRLNTADWSFRLHDTKELSGSLMWSDHAGQGTMKNRETALNLRNPYKLSWNSYSNEPEQLKYLALQVR